MPADHQQKSTCATEAHLHMGPICTMTTHPKPLMGMVPNKLIVHNTAYGKPGLWDCPSWNKKRVKDFYRHLHKYSKGWLPHGITKAIKPCPLDPEYLAARQQEYEEHLVILHKQSEQLFTEHACMRCAEAEAEAEHRRLWLSARPIMPPSLLSCIEDEPECIQSIIDRVKKPTECVEQCLKDIPDDISPFKMALCNQAVVLDHIWKWVVDFQEEFSHMADAIT
ncbi:hypothetical protein WOLCODRAFT_17314 [Wolfiporia cocos MD-104 SS10]|uniref:Uncharacterized protein n=1 Tax=Wolfiporia cocos (strain MD-104) TaxID=742152 RepID=A0A2H3JV74_WOLCO|nr:hypothetical protein WOLCODRAFT_17314 [Wolfiporia cocos MD-104 SS10]